MCTGHGSTHTDQLHGEGHTAFKKIQKGVMDVAWARAGGSAPHTAQSTPDTGKRRRGCKSHRGDLNKALSRLGLDVAATSRLSLVAGGGDVMERLVPRAVQRPAECAAVGAVRGADVLKSCKPSSGKRRIVYWLPPQQELCFTDVTDPRCLSYLSLRQTNIICISLFIFLFVFTLLLFFSFSFPLCLFLSSFPLRLFLSLFTFPRPLPSF